MPPSLCAPTRASAWLAAGQSPETKVSSPRTSRPHTPQVVNAVSGSSRKSTNGPSTTKLVPLPRRWAPAPHPAAVELREQQLDFHLAKLQLSQGKEKAQGGWVDFELPPSVDVPEKGSLDASNPGSSHTPEQSKDKLRKPFAFDGHVFVSRGTLLQRCDTQESNLTDVYGSAVKVQIQLLQQVISSTLPRQVFEHCYRLGVPQAPDVARALEKRRIQNSLRRVKENLERVRPVPLDLGLVFDALKAASKQLVDGGSTGAASACDSLDNYMSYGSFLFAIESLGWWAEELNAADKKETALAISLADQIAHPKQRLAMRKVLPQGVTKRGFVLAFEYLPFNLPEWPLTHDRLPPASRLQTPPPNFASALLSPPAAPSVVSPRQPVSEAHASMEARGPAQRKRQTDPCVAKQEAVLLCQAALLLCLIFGFDVLAAFPAFRVKTSCSDTAAAAAAASAAAATNKSEEGPERQTTGDQTSAAQRLLSGSPLLLRAGEMEASVYTAAPFNRGRNGNGSNSNSRTSSVSRQSSTTRRTQQQRGHPKAAAPSRPPEGRKNLVPCWHLAQDYLLSRLVSVEELQAALPCLLSVDWVSRGLSLVVGTATAVLSPVEWLPLLRPDSCASQPIETSAIVHRYKKMYPRPAPIKVPPTAALVLRLQQDRQQEQQQKAQQPEQQEQQPEEQQPVPTQHREAWETFCTPSGMGLRWNSYTLTPQKTKKKQTQHEQTSAAAAAAAADAELAATGSQSARNLLGLGCTEEEQQEWVLQQVARHVLFMADSDKTSKAVSRLVTASACGTLTCSGKDPMAVAAGESFCLDLHVLQFCVETFFRIFSSADIFKEMHLLV